jgi:hypothetical protein
MLKQLLVMALCALPLVACGGDPVSYSAPVGINLKAKSSDTANNTVSAEKGISTESGNPFKVFVDQARLELEGQSPSRVELTSLTLLLGAQSVGTASLTEVFASRVEVLFLMDESNNTYVAGRVESVMGSGGAIPMIVEFDSEALSAADYARFLDGKFKVVLRGAAASGFATKGAEADFQATFTFTALE